MRRRAAFQLVLWFCILIAHRTLGENGNMAEKIILSELDSPIVLRGDSKTSYRDPAVIYHEGVFNKISETHVDELRQHARARRLEPLSIALAQRYGTA